jgi:hypothetical protein
MDIGCHISRMARLIEEMKKTVGKGP